MFLIILILATFTNLQAYLHSIQVTAHGILGMTVIENRAYITAVLHEDNEEIQTIRILPPNLVSELKSLCERTS